MSKKSRFVDHRQASLFDAPAEAPAIPLLSEPRSSFRVRSPSGVVYACSPRLSVTEERAADVSLGQTHDVLVDEFVGEEWVKRSVFRRGEKI